MKETFLKVILILVAAGIIVPLLVSRWPSGAVRNTDTSRTSDNNNAPVDWKQYSTTDLTLWHPDELEEDNTAVVSGFTSIEDEQHLVTFTIPETVTNSDAPFDGFSLYSYDFAENNIDLTFEELIGAEKLQMQSNFKAMAGTNESMPSITSQTIKLGSHEVTKIVTPFSSIVMYYIPTERSKQVLLFSGVEREANSFIPQLEEIIETLELE